MPEKLSEKPETASNTASFRLFPCDIMELFIMVRMEVRGEWVLTSYLLTICATLPILGKLSDLFGRSRVYNLGFLLFALGSGLCSMSGSLGFLIASRIVQAIGASCLIPNSQAIIVETLSHGGRGKALGITCTMVSLGSLTGPALEGFS